MQRFRHLRIIDMNTPQMEDFEKKMENLSTPEIRSESRKNQLKLTLLNAKKSAYVGFVLIILPFLFAFANIFKYQLGIDLGFLSAFVTWIGSFDDTPVINWVLRILLLGGPIVAVLVNLLAITHFQIDKHSNEFIITFKLKWLNITIILFCCFVLLIFILYLVAENLM